MKKCWKCSIQTLSEYLDGELEAYKQPKVETHLQGCSVCQNELARLKERKHQLQSLPVMKLSADFDVEFKSALLEAEREKKKKEAVVEPVWPKRRTIFVGLPVPVQVFAVLILAVTVTLGVTNLLSPGSGTYLAALEGVVEISHPDSEDWVPVNKRIQLVEGDQIRTGPEGVALLASGRSYQAKLLENSEIVPLDIGTYSPDNLQFILKKGTLHVKTGKAFAGKTMRVASPSGEVTIVGTAFMMQALPDRVARLSVIEGKVDFTSKKNYLDHSTLRVGRFESSKIYPQGTPQRTEPISSEDFQLFVQNNPEIFKDSITKELAQIAEDKKRLNQQDLKHWQRKLMGESDLELASFGLYLLGEVHEEAMAPAEALQQYVSVLTHFPKSIESSWAFEFLRTKLDMVPNDEDVIGEEIPIQDFSKALKKATTAKNLTSNFLKGTEPQRKFISTRFDVESVEGTSYLVERAITFERNLGDKNYRPIGYLDSVKDPKTNSVLLRIGKLFTRKSAGGPLSSVNMAVFHPDGRLLYTSERELFYQGKMLIGYVELFKDPNGNDLALLSRRIESRSGDNLVLRYTETLKNANKDVLLSRKRSNMIYNEEGKLIDYEDLLVDVYNRVVLEQGHDRLKVEIGKEKLLQVQESPFRTMDEVLKTLKKIRSRSTPFDPELETRTPFRTR